MRFRLPSPAPTDCCALMSGTAGALLLSPPPLLLPLLPQALSTSSAAVASTAADVKRRECDRVRIRPLPRFVSRQVTRYVWSLFQISRVRDPRGIAAGSFMPLWATVAT